MDDVGDSADAGREERVVHAGQRTGVLLVLTWLVMTSANVWSVAHFEWRTALILTAVLPVLLLALAASHRGLDIPPRLLMSAALVGVAWSVYGIDYFSYLPVDVRETCMRLAAGTALACAALWAIPRRWAGTAALALAGSALVVTTAVIIEEVPAPRIDVWYSLDQGSTGLRDGRNPYSTTFVGGPGVADAFTYLPMTLVFLAPFRLLFGDVRWGLLVALLVAGWLLARLGRPSAGGRHSRVDPRAAVLLLWLTPGQLAQTEQSWTEPLLFALVVGVLWCVERGHLTTAVLVLALALATKQHAAFLLPALAMWRPFGPRRTLAAVGIGGALCLPWFLWDPADFWYDTVTLLVNYPPLPRSPNLYIWLYNNGTTIPYAISAGVVLLSLLGSALLVRREQPPVGRLALVWATLLLALNLVNKQAFYNQFWFVGALVLAALATAARPPVGRPAVTTERTRTGARPRVDR